jgi:membrane dipeptidase
MLHFSIAKNIKGGIMEHKSNPGNNFYSQKLEKYLIIDAHNDLLIDVEKKRNNGRKKVIETDYLSEIYQGGVNLVVSSIFIDDMFMPEMALRKSLKQISTLYSEIEESEGKIMLCKNHSDIVKAKGEGKLGMILSFEGVEPLYNDISLLKVFQMLGVRIVGLMWSRRNSVCDGSSFTNEVEDKGSGLTDFGFNLVKEAEKLGMLIDLSHMNDQGFWDVMSIVDKPVIASHSNCRALNSIRRNLTDEQIKQIALTDGVIGVNGASILVSGTDDESNLDYFVNHIDHIVDLVGIRHVGLGLDLCDKLFTLSSIGHIQGINRRVFDVLRGYDDINELVEKLINRGYRETEIGQILGGNFLRVYQQVIK